MAQIKASKDTVKGILLVGGFGENTYLRDVIRQEVQGSEIEVIQPQDGFVIQVTIFHAADGPRWTAVVRGALMKGLASASPSCAKVSIIGRSARKHYGVWIQTKFKPEIHETRRRSVVILPIV